MIISLPYKLLCYLFEFLDHKDYFAVAVTCKRFTEVFKDHNKYWIRECFGRYFSFELDLYSEIYQSEDYKLYIKNKIFSLTKKLWKQHLVQGEKQKKQFSLLLTQIATKERADSFVDYVSQTLKEPNLPVYRLKRETIVQSTQTFFQNKLSEILYEDTFFKSKGFNLCDENKGLIDELQNHSDKLFQQALMHDKKELLQARWYLFETSDNLLDETISFEERSEEDMDFESHNLPSLKRLSNASTEDLALFKNDHCFLISLYDCLQNMLSHFCGLVFDYLNSLDNTYDLISEYNARWKTYVCSMLELEKTFETFTNLINKNYETIFEGYPCFPKFSILRLMTKIWVKQVYEKAGLNRYLNEAFLQILVNYREKNLQKALGDNTSILHMEDQDNSNNLPKCLYVNLQTKNRQSLSSESSDYCQLTENIQNFFGGCIDAEKELLSNFMQSILDISLTEVNIHYLDCSELPVTCPYRELEDLFLQHSNDFYESYQPSFNQSPEYFCHFLKSDDCLFSEILIQRTKARFENLHLEKGFSFMKNVMHAQLQKVNLQELTPCEKQSFFSEQRGEVDDFMENLAKQIIEEVEKDNLCKEINNFCLFSLDHLSNEEQMSEELRHSNPCVVEHLNDKAFIQKALLAIESKCAHIRNDFSYLIQRQKSLEKGREMDEYIKQNNKDKNIPFEMGDVDNLFYDLDKEVTISLLEKLYEDYLIFMKEQGKEGLELGNLPELEDEEMGDNNNININQDFGILGNFGQNFGDDMMEDLDLLNLDNLQLRRTLL